MKQRIYYEVESELAHTVLFVEDSGYSVLKHVIH